MTATAEKSPKEIAVEATAATVSKLKAFGITAEPYKAAPLNSETTGINLNRGGTKLRLWIGSNTQLRIAGSKRHRQAVLWVDEPARTVSTARMVQLSSWQLDLFASIERKRVSKKEKREQYLSTLHSEYWDVHHVNVGYEVSHRSVRVSVSDNDLDKLVEFVKAGKNKDGFWPDYFKIRVEWRIRVRKTSNTMLLGYDEERMFVCMLPERVDTVPQAHEALKPEGWNKTWRRHGEFFLKPVSPDLETELTVELARKGEKYRHRHNDMGLEPYSTHTADAMLKRGRTRYVIGTVRDSRRGRHADIELLSWHEVVRNREVVVSGLRTNPLTANAAMFD